MDKTKAISELLKNAQELETIEKDIVEARITLANLQKDIKISNKQKSELDEELKNKKQVYVEEIDRLNNNLKELQSKTQVVSNQNNLELSNIENKRNSLVSLQSEHNEKIKSIEEREKGLNLQKVDFEKKLHILKEIASLIKQL